MNRLSLLLVEDNDDDRFLTIRLLKKLPTEPAIEIAKNGDEAFRVIRSGDAAGCLPSLILLDLQLPKIGGITFLSRLREQYPPAVLPVIVLSSSDNPADIAQCNRLGVSGYLSKPLNLEEFQKHLDTLTPP